MRFRHSKEFWEAALCLVVVVIVIVWAVRQLVR